MSDDDVLELQEARHYYRQAIRVDLDRRELRHMNNMIVSIDWRRAPRSDKFCAKKMNGSILDTSWFYPDDTKAESCIAIWKKYH